MTTGVLRGFVGVGLGTDLMEVQLESDALLKLGQQPRVLVLLEIH